MDPIKQRIAIAKAHGFGLVGAFDEYGSICVDLINPDGIKCARNGPGVTWEHIPNQLYDYLNDLNAMHAAEKIETICCDWKLYCRKLEDICNPKGFLFKPEIEATAAQRAEAFLRTIGKWEES